MGGKTVSFVIAVVAIVCAAPVALVTPVMAQSVAAGALPAHPAGAAVVTVDVTNGELEGVLRSIASQAGLKLSFQSDGVPVSKRISMSMRSVSVADAFAQALAGTGLRAEFVSGRVVLTGTADVLHALVAQGGISGKVVDAKTKLGLRGATLTLDDNTKGTTSGDGGAFRFANVVPGEHALRVRMLGYLKATKAVTVVEGQTVSVDLTLDRSVNALDQVVVTGTVVPTEQKAVPNAMTVITAKELEQRGITHIDQLFRGDVPGLFALNQGSGGATPDGNSLDINPLDRVTMFSRGGTMIPGGGIVTATNPIKTYVDGVELANAGYLSQIDPKSIERIEILTGPQASTIYGSNAINGVMQIFTKRGNQRTRPQLSATLLSGVVQNNYSPARAPQHDYSAQVTGTEGRWSYNAGGSWNYVAPWSPARQTSRTDGFGAARLNGGPLTADVSLRLGFTQNWARGSGEQEETAAGVSGFYRPNYAVNSRTGVSRATLHGQTMGLTLTYAPAAWWSQELVLGTDVSSTETLRTEPVRYAPSDSALGLNQTADTRQSVRYSTTAKVSVTHDLQATMTVGADGWHSLSTSLSLSPTVLTGTLSYPYTNVTRQPGHNAGGFVQGQLGAWDALFLTYGLRAEWNPNYGADAQPNLAPRYGVAYTRELGAVTIKLRGSYGRSTRPPLPGQKRGQYAKGSYVDGIVADYGNFLSIFPNPDLAAEHQQGGEGGVELYFGTRGSLIVTRYNQTVDGLITSATVDSARSLFPNPNYTTSDLDENGYGYFTQGQYLNIGSIRNQGWELQGSLNTGPLTTRGTYSWTKSRFLGITPKYRAQFSCCLSYLPGASFNSLPEHTWAASMTYGQPTTTVTLNVNGTGKMYQRIDEFYQSVTSIVRLSASKPRMSTPNGYLGTASGYVTADLNASKRLHSTVDGLLQVQNVTDHYQNDFEYGYATMGRQTKVGLRIRW